MLRFADLLAYKLIGTWAAWRCLGCGSLIAVATKVANLRAVIPEEIDMRLCPVCGSDLEPA